PKMIGQLRDTGDREVRSVAERIHGGVLHDHPWQMPEEILHGAKDRADRSVVAVLLPICNGIPECVEWMGVRLAECRRAGPSQVDEIRADSERITDVRAERANVGPGFASHPEEDVPTVDLKRFELVHVPGPLLPFDRRADRRNLKDLSDESAHHRSNPPLVDVLM